MTSPTGLRARLDVRHGGFRLDASLAVAAGEVVALVGPNGSGKSSALSVIAGLTALDSGRVEANGTVFDDPEAGVFVPANRRRVAVVFQHHLLFPHLNVTENVAFGLRARGVARADAVRTAHEWLDRFGLADKATLSSRRLSGGEAQRVALARALAASPEVLLLDEPLAALDAGTHATVRAELRRHLQGFSGPTVVVTHDPIDALVLASRAVVLDDGRAVQAGPVGELSNRPRSRYVADLFGLNLLAGRARTHTVELADGGGSLTVSERAEGDVYALVRPDAVALFTSEPEGSPRNRWRALVTGFEPLGERVRVHLGGPVPLTAEVTAGAFAALGLHEGAEVWAAVKATEVATYPR